jgi:thiol-disulfide isomerase/thioredoxin
MKKSIALLPLALVALIGCAAPSSAKTTTLTTVLAASDWLNGRPTTASVQGKVVLLDFYTFVCYNCKNVEPNLRALYKDKPRSELVILGVHSPETPYEHSRRALIESFAAQGVAWPVAVDNDFAIWNAYGVGAWPTQMIFDRHGMLRQTIIGDSQDASVNAAVDRLLNESR